MLNLVFDLDNTLYPHNPGIEADFARRIKDYFRRFLEMDFDNSGFDWEKASVNIGAFLDGVFAGREGQRGEFMKYISDVDVSSIPRNPELDRLLSELPQDKYIFTDSTLGHVRDSLNQIGVEINRFKGFFDNLDSGFRLKTDPEAYRRFLAQFRLQPADCILFEDNLNNLLPAAEKGLTTVLISPTPRQNPGVDYQFPDIVSALSGLF